jgi:hypothetical protein
MEYVNNHFIIASRAYSLHFKGHASYALTKEEKKIFFECLSSIKVPSGFSSNIKGIVNMAEKKIPKPKVS